VQTLINTKVFDVCPLQKRWDKTLKTRDMSAAPDGTSQEHTAAAFTLGSKASRSGTASLFDDADAAGDDVPPGLAPAAHGLASWPHGGASSAGDASGSCLPVPWCSLQQGGARRWRVWAPRPALLGNVDEDPNLRTPL